MVSTEIQKQRAISLHSTQAAEFAASYQELAADAYQTCFTYSRKRLDEQLERYLPQRGDGLRLLDVGCGTGHHLARLRERGFVIAGVDGSAEMLEHARHNNPAAELRHADVEALPFADNSFDFVLCVEVLRYLPASARCIAELSRVLSPGGVCLATAAPLLNLNGYWLVNRIAHAVPVGSLVRLKQFFATSARLRREFIAAGFATTRIHGVYWGPINWVEHLAPGHLSRVLQRWEPLDAALADRPLLRECANMFLVQAVKANS